METRRTFTQEIAVPEIAMFETVKILHTTPNSNRARATHIISCDQERKYISKMNKNIIEVIEMLSNCGKNHFTSKIKSQLAKIKCVPEIT